MRESDIQQQIVQMLSLYAGRTGLVYFSVPNEAWGAGRGKKKLSGKEYNKIGELKRMGMNPGVSDLIILCNGKAFCMEVKTSTGRQSEKQKLFMKNVLGTGCDYAIVRSVDDAVECLKIWGII